MCRFVMPLAALCLVLAASGCGGTATHVYTVPSSAMEPTIHCAKPGPGCRGKGNDRVVVQLSGASHLKRQDIVVFTTPPKAAAECGEGGIFVKRIIGLPGETIHEDGHGIIFIDDNGLNEPYVLKRSRLSDTNNFNKTWHVSKGGYFVMGDNRAESCDSRVWGSVPAHNIIGRVVKIIHAG